MTHYHPQVYTEQESAEIKAVLMSCDMENVPVYVYFNTSGKYIADIVDGPYSNEILVATYLNGNRV